MNLDNIASQYPERGESTFFCVLLPEQHVMKLMDMRDEHLVDIIKTEIVSFQNGFEITEELPYIDTAVAKYRLYTNTPSVKSVTFDVVYDNLPITVMIDYVAKTITLFVNPVLSLEDKKRLADFFKILMYEESVYKDAVVNLKNRRKFIYLAILFFVLGFIFH